MISRHLYPTEAWPLSKLEQHPCVPLLIANAKDPATKPGRKRELSALMALLQHLAKDPAAYAEPRPLSRAFATVPNMPADYDVGALIDELVRLRLFVVQIRNFDAMLVPAESVSAKAEPAKAKHVTLGGKVSPDLAEQFRAAASQAGTNVSALIAQFIADYVAAHS